jgi:hypothetical protein
VICLCGNNGLHFDFRYDREEWTGQTAIVVVPEGSNDDRLWEATSHYFDRVEPLDPVEVKRAGQTVLVLNLARGEGLRYPPK